MFAVSGIKQCKGKKTKLCHILVIFFNYKIMPQKFIFINSADLYRVEYYRK